MFFSPHSAYARHTTACDAKRDAVTPFASCPCKLPRHRDARNSFSFCTCAKHRGWGIPFSLPPRSWHLRAAISLSNRPFVFNRLHTLPFYVCSKRLSDEDSRPERAQRVEGSPRFLFSALRTLSFCVWDKSFLCFSYENCRSTQNNSHFGSLRVLSGLANSPSAHAIRPHFAYHRECTP